MQRKRSRKTHTKYILKKDIALVDVAQLVRIGSRKPKGCGFDSQSGHKVAGLVQSRVRK